MLSATKNHGVEAPEAGMGGSIPTAPSGVPVINPRNRRAGKVLAAHQVFTASGGLQFQAYVRNTFDEQDKIDGVKHCLRVIATPRLEGGGYGSPLKADEHLSLEVARDSLLGLAGVFAGHQPSCSVRVPRPGKDLKELHLKRQAERGRPPFFLTLSAGKRSCSVGFGLYDAWAYRMVVARVLVGLFPHLDTALLQASFEETARGL